MKLIIDIDEKIIEQAKAYHDIPYDDYVIRVAEAIANGKSYEEQPQGEWVPKQLWDNTHIWVCSKCGNQNTHGITVEKACWKCGADMRGEENE